MHAMNQRTIVRSLTTTDGTLVAMNDGMLAWKPLDGRPTRTVVEGLPTVLLALRGPMGPVDATVVGTATGDVHVLTLPRLESVATFQLKSGSVRAITLVEEGASTSLLAPNTGLSGRFAMDAPNGANWCSRSTAPSPACIWTTSVFIRAAGFDTSARGTAPLTTSRTPPQATCASATASCRNLPFAVSRLDGFGFVKRPWRSWREPNSGWSRTIP